MAMYWWQKIMKLKPEVHEKVEMGKKVEVKELYEILKKRPK